MARPVIRKGQPSSEEPALNGGATWRKRDVWVCLFVGIHVRDGQ